MILPVYQVSVKKKNTTSEMITTLLVREGFTKKSSRSFGFCSNYLDPPTPQFGQLVPLFLNAKNVDSSDIQDYSSSKIPLI